MKLELVAYTHDVEVLIAAAMLTTSSSSKPSTIFHSLEKDLERMERLVGRIEVQNGILRW